MVASTYCGNNLMTEITQLDDSARVIYQRKPGTAANKMMALGKQVTVEGEFHPLIK